jgi:hypothetical protein
MKIEREGEVQYIPLKLTFNTLNEEKDFMSIIDKLDAYKNRSVQFDLTPTEHGLIRNISNWFTGNSKY